MYPRAWICQKSLDQAESGPLWTATNRSDQVLTGAQLAHRLLVGLVLFLARRRSDEVVLRRS
jgi:hypothetical protein